MKIGRCGDNIRINVTEIWQDTMEMCLGTDTAVRWVILQGRELQQGSQTATRRSATLLLTTPLRAPVVYTYINTYFAKCVCVWGGGIELPKTP